MRLFLPLLLLTLLNGCGTPSTLKMYDGPERPSFEVASLSHVGLYPDRKLSLRVLSIDGNPVTDHYATDFHLLPGKYKLTLQFLYDIDICAPGVACYYKTDIEKELNAEKGHTYIPNAEITEKIDNKIKFNAFLEDKGVNYPTICLHAKQINRMLGKVAPSPPEC